ncbi:hypothetical protein BDZ89DRAFT_1071853 [Hymenopellis radicata]|nr:hypothetical protein BDZ89DRAFT_1071853 [Hymenopellis radicata]
MTRRTSTRTTAIQEDNHLPPAPPAPPVAPSSSPELAILRTHWKWAAFSQFFYTFAPMLAMDDVSLNDIEEDLACGNTVYLPRIIQRLLYTLSYDRKVSNDNWQTALRKQYYKRDPEANPIGPDPFLDVAKYSRTTGSAVTPDPQSRARTEDRQRGDSEAQVKNETPAPDDEEDQDENVAESKDWRDLTMLEKLDSIHLLMEWQFQNATRLRTLMKSDDDYATWVFDERLWMQRAPPKAPRGPKTLKRKRPPPKANGKKAVKAATAKRARVEKAAAPSKGKGKGKAKVSVPESPLNRHSRAAKSQANLKLDAQAKELEELNRQAVALARGEAGLRTSSRRQSSPLKNTISVRSLGTRTSARLRGSEDDEEWQAVPEEWLHEDSGPSTRRSKRKALSETSSVSDLTELTDSDASDSDAEEDEEDEEEPEATDVEEAEDEPMGADEQSSQLPADSVEWETLCVTIYDWENIAQRWENATHYTEKAFYKMLTKNIVPIIVEELKRQETERRKKFVEEVVTTRKRSSRIAMKESTREEARLAIKKQTESEEKNSRAKRAEARQQKEEDSRQRREAAREERREREAQEAKEAQEEEERNMRVDVVGNGTKPKANGRSSRGGQAKVQAAQQGSSNGTRTPVDGDWELDCEICHRHGTNLDGDYRLVSCNACGKWQHIQCHDTADRRKGLTIRNWEAVDFFCKRCLHTSHPPRVYNGGGLPLQTSREQYLGAHPQTAYSNYPPRPTDYALYPQYTQPKSYPAAVSDVRSNGHVAPVYNHSTSQSKPSHLSFNHYQPQQHGFSQYPGPVQSYGQMASTSSGRYTQPYSANGYGEYAPPPPQSNSQWTSEAPSSSYGPGYPPSADRGYSDAWPQKMSDPYAATNYRPNT